MRPQRRISNPSATESVRLFVDLRIWETTAALCAESVAALFHRDVDMESRCNSCDIDSTPASSSASSPLERAQPNRGKDVSAFIYTLFRLTKHLAISLVTANSEMHSETFPIHKSKVRNSNGCAISDSLANAIELTQN